MKVSANRNSVTLCKGDVCLTVFGEFAKALALVAIIGVAALATNELLKVLK
jgi:hypothetical protein